MKAIILSLFALALPIFSVANSSSQVIPYYGEKFYLNLNSGISNEDLKNNIKTVLRTPHRRVNGTYDQITPNCSGQGCYTQTSLGYDGARIFLLGGFYLIDHRDGSYGVRDVYCDTERTGKDFGGNPPKPGRIPDNTIVNTEHTWPQSHFTRKYDRSLQKADMHHLFPTDSKVNSTRGNFQFGEVTKDLQAIRCGTARFGLSSDGRTVFQPPSNHRGNAARALFYFSLRYDLPITPKEEQTLKKWAQEDPVDEEELRRNEEIYKAQGNRNPFVDFPDLQERISDF